MRTLIGLLGFATAVVCAAQEPLMQVANAPDEIAFSQIEVGRDSPIKKSGVMVITTQAQWTEFVKKLDEESLKKPKIDWTKYQIVVATFEGSSNTPALQPLRLHRVKSGKIDIEFSLSKDHAQTGISEAAGNVHVVPSTPEFPYAILKTPILTSKWDIRVVD